MAFCLLLHSPAVTWVYRAPNLIGFGAEGVRVALNMLYRPLPRQYEYVASVTAVFKLQVLVLEVGLEG